MSFNEPAWGWLFAGMTRSWGGFFAGLLVLAFLPLLLPLLLLAHWREKRRAAAAAKGPPSPPPALVVCPVCGRETTWHTCPYGCEPPK